MSNYGQPHAAALAEGFSLRQLADGIGQLELNGVEDVLVMGVCDDSRHVKPGYAMICLPRAASEVDEYARVAEEQGAIAVIAVGIHVNSSLPQLQLESMQQAGLLLRRLFKTEQAGAHLYGITGTDGKTSVAWMLREALSRYQQQPVWSTGTLGWMRSHGDVCDIGNTTPSLLTMHAMLTAACLDEVHSVVCEVSSHGIAQERIAGLDFKTVIWTNMGHDHLQDHGGYAPYLAIKAGFVHDATGHGGNVIANADHADIRERAPEFSCWYGHGLFRDDVDLGWEQELPGLLRLRHGDDEVVIEDIPLGDFHAENVACVALALMSSQAVTLQELPELLSGITAPPGRMQDVMAGFGQVFIDYAHTPEALESCLKAARKLARKRLIVVFGCGGERDREKRPKMGEIASDLADVVWITSDNPRGELPAVIASEIEAGMVQPYHAEVHLQLDREQAISEAVDTLTEGDILIVAGKGHEAYMEVCGKRLPWSDLDVAENLLQRKNMLVEQCVGGAS